MSQPAITVNNVSKRFLIGAADEQATTFYDALSSLLLSPLKRFRRLSQKASSAEEFWALKDVSFEVSEGEVIGIIGHNGAGKSTLLKILSRITEPTDGRIEIHGRVASLLEVGTGFHPELTGRENIYLNGSILGMTRAEIDRNFDAIVEFSGMERFLDTPFKRYSSGMGVRLAFAVAAHLDPEILIIDEVLAVGDAQFQRKCLGKMSEVAGSGRTVLFVSHNMSAVQNLCQRTVLLDHGRVIADGPSTEVVDHYLHALNEQSSSGAELSSVSGVSVKVDIRGLQGDLCKPNEPVEFVVDVTTEEPISEGHLAIGIDDHHGIRLTTLNSYLQSTEAFQFEHRARFSVQWDRVNLTPGTYWLSISLVNSLNRVAHWERGASFVVSEGDFFGTGRLPDPNHQGNFMIPVKWTVTTDESITGAKEPSP
ncbi:MAG: ABC transporter ATP-binding protein [Planctomycetaceae bacterium]|nr:ABC transporter ATP-binding protein [Planctomycetaceae bacterium]